MRTFLLLTVLHANSCQVLCVTDVVFCVHKSNQMLPAEMIKSRFLCRAGDLYKQDKQYLKSILNMPDTVDHTHGNLRVVTTTIKGQGATKTGKGIFMGALWTLCHKPFSHKDLRSTANYKVIPMTGKNKDLEFLALLIPPVSKASEDFQIKNTSMYFYHALMCTS
jgi:hypothetical protein